MGSLRKPPRPRPRSGRRSRHRTSRPGRARRTRSRRSPSPRRAARRSATAPLRPSRSPSRLSRYRPGPRRPPPRRRRSRPRGTVRQSRRTRLRPLGTRRRSPEVTRDCREGASTTDTFSLAEPVRVGTRASALALSQATQVADLLVGAGIHEGYELVEVGHDGGDPSAFAGGQVMTGALRKALLEGRCDVAVHMLKDLPHEPVPGLRFGAYVKRLDPREALCARNGWTLATLPEGARVALSSPLRRAQLLEARPDLTIVGIRGPIESRLQRVLDGEFDATLLAWAVLSREGRLDSVTEVLEPSVMLPTPCQGVLVVEVREDAPRAITKALRRIDHACTRLVTTAERALPSRINTTSSARYAASPRS